VAWSIVHADSVACLLDDGMSGSDALEDRKKYWFLTVIRVMLIDGG